MIAKHFIRFSLALISLLALVPIDAMAIDCSVAKLPIERTICADPVLKAADDALGSAYKAALVRLSNPTFREALIKSQRQWVEARASGPEEYRMDGEDTPFDVHAILLKMTKDRTDFLMSEGTFDSLTMQRDLADKFRGGPYAGLRAGCSFIPPPFRSNWDYQCSATISRQRGNRIVSKDVNWASGHTTQIRYKGAIVNGVPKIEFFCEVGYDASKRCYDTEEEEETPGSKIHWYPVSVAGSGFEGPILTELSIYDADVNINEENIDWMDTELGTSDN